MQFGLICEFRNPAQWKRPQTDVYDEIMDYICRAEELGFHAVEMLEHHFVNDGYIPSPLVALSALAARTKKMRLASDVALLPLYDPVRFAEDTAIIDTISHGRLDVGVSIGYRDLEYNGYRIDIKTRGARMDELVQIVRRLWHGESVTFDGKYYKLKDVKVTPSPVQQPNPPLFMGGFAPAAIRRAARYGDGYTAVWAGESSKQAYKIYTDELKAVGKDPAKARVRLCKTGFLVVSKEPEKSFNEFAPYVIYWANSYASWFEGSGTKLWDPIPDADVLKGTGLLTVLTPDKAVDFLKDMLSAVPVEMFNMELTPPGMPCSKSFKSIELFAKEVLPAFQ
jgi:alkanesulfonate monooxygenase SsuD/methylene tetrahydromethanopterin reductase-like flavin-dependent oxidoreductase (luciferase family)